MKYQIAQINVGRLKAPLYHPIMKEFVENLEPINALAEQSKGFVWRLKTEEGNATQIKPFEDDMIIVNISVWKTFEDLKNYVYKSKHTHFLKRRKEWFELFKGIYYATWWIPEGQIPSIEEAKKRLEFLNEHGDSEYSFTFQRTFPQPKNRN